MKKKSYDAQSRHLSREQLAAAGGGNWWVCDDIVSPLAGIGAAGATTWATGGAGAWAAPVVGVGAASAAKHGCNYVYDNWDSFGW
jgi:hypothetical protein